MKSEKRKYLYLLLFLLCFGLPVQVFSQGGFQLPHGKKKDRIPFKLVNNLVVIPVEVNGKELSFLLDTGVDHTLLFNLEERDSMLINNVTPVLLRGLGEGGDIEALKSRNNQIRVGKAVDTDHKIYVIFNQALNFSPRMGIPIHGIIGYDLFKDFVVKTDYESELITLYEPESYKPRRCRNCESFDIVISRNKPYVRNKIVSNDATTHEVTLLIDSGASDALWLFDEDYGITDTPKNYFTDFLGLGLSGRVNGKRSKLREVSMGSFSFKNVNVAYPDSLALKNLRRSSSRHGTLGSDILRRFTVTMDYGSKKLTLKKNNHYKRPFHYNMSGIVLEHSGLVPVKSVNKKSQEALRIELGRKEKGK
ncbi:MAG: retropepsin-like aspartic protease [Bacteroidota bacterium]